MLNLSDSQGHSGNAGALHMAQFGWASISIADTWGRNFSENGEGGSGSLIKHRGWTEKYQEDKQTIAVFIPDWAPDPLVESNAGGNYSSSTWNAATLRSRER
jgi:hypothetical protein